jgi:hypothetical protein
MAKGPDAFTQTFPALQQQPILAYEKISYFLTGNLLLHADEEIVCDF